MIEIGNEKRFFDFIKDLNDKDKIMLISHTDLDGIASAKIVNEVIDANDVMFANYGDLNLDLVEKLKLQGHNKVILTDLMIKEGSFFKELEKFANVLILDHHPVVEDWNSEKTVFLKAEEGYCATYLCYKLFDKIQSLEKLDWLVAGACVSDFCHIKPEKWLDVIYKKYGDLFMREGDYVKKEGTIWDLQLKLSLALIYFKDDLKKVYDSIGSEFGEIGDLGKYAGEVQEDVDRIFEDFEKNKVEFKDGYLFEIKPKFSVGSIVSNVLATKYRDKIILIIRKDGDCYKLSARRQDREMDMGKFVVKLLEGFEGAGGGGHIPAAGGMLPAKYFNEFKERLGIK